MWVKGVGQRSRCFFLFTVLRFYHVLPPVFQKDLIFHAVNVLDVFEEDFRAKSL